MLKRRGRGAEINAMVRKQNPRRASNPPDTCSLMRADMSAGGTLAGLHAAMRTYNRVKLRVTCLNHRGATPKNRDNLTKKGQRHKRGTTPQIINN